MFEDATLKARVKAEVQADLVAGRPNDHRGKEITVRPGASGRPRKDGKDA
jgi:hypothetical protein